MEKLGIASNLYKQFRVGRYCDLHIEVENTTFKAHRCVVSAASWVLEAILHSSTQDTGSTRVAIQLHGVTSYAISVLLGFIYTGQLDPEVFVDNNKQREVLHAAKLYKLDDITDLIQSGGTSAPSSDSPAVSSIPTAPSDGLGSAQPSVNTVEVVLRPNGATPPSEEIQKQIVTACKISKDNGLLYCILCTKICADVGGLVEHMSTHKPQEPEPETQKTPQRNAAAIASASMVTDDSVDDIDDVDDTDFTAVVTPKKRRKIATRKSFACVECGLSHTSKTQLTKHHKSQHADMFFCNLCDKHFKSEDLFQAHVATHKEENKSDENPKKVVSPTKSKRKGTRTPRKIYSCNLCGSNFEKKKLLSEHQKSFHGILKLMHVCTLCGREFKEKAGLRSHTRVHTGEKPFMCSYCGNSFADQKTWKDHERRHRGEKPFLCTTCGKSFTYRQSFTRHMKFHEGKRPFQCSFCGKAFVLRQNLREHEKRHNK